jgi:hypothetical protein
MARKPIEIVRETEEHIDEATGIVVTRDIIKKGLLNRATDSIENSARWHELKPDGDDVLAVKWLESAKISTQSVLSAAGLQTDDACNLYGVLRLEKLIEPLSKEEAAAKLIDGINHVLALENKQAAWAALNFASALHDFLLADGLNEHVMADFEAVKNRDKGPKAKTFEAEKAREIIKPICEELWLRRGSLRNTFSGTAQTIEKKVNDALAKARLKPIKAKAIAEHIKKLFPPMASNGN